MKLYVIGSLRNPSIPAVSARLRKLMPAATIFDDWHAAGPTADDSWREYSKAKGQTYMEALEDNAAGHVFSYDKRHLDSSDGALLVLPAGKSAHLELGYMLGKGKWGGIIIDDPDRWDVMVKFADWIGTDLSCAAASFACWYNAEAIPF